MTTMKTDKPAIISKLNVWFNFFIDDCNPKTYLNKTESAIAAGYKCRTKNAYDCFCSIGSQNFRKLHDRIAVWLDEEGLSENYLKLKLKSLISAKEKKLFAAPIKDESGVVVDIMIKEHEVEAIETQRKTLDLACKVQDMIAPTRHEVAGKKGGKIEVEHSLDDTWKDLLLSVTGDNTDDLPNAGDK